MRTWLALCVGAVSSLALGMLLGVVWAGVSPRVELFVASDGKAYPEGYQPEGYMTDDGVAAALCLAAGLIVGTLVVLVLRRWTGAERGVRLAVPVAVVLGALGAAGLWWTGTRLGGFDLAEVLATAVEGETLASPLRLRMPGVLVLWPAASVLVVFIVALADWVRDRDTSSQDDGVTSPR